MQKTFGSVDLGEIGLAEMERRPKLLQYRRMLWPSQ